VDDEQHTRLTAKARAKAEEAVDKWLDRHHREVEQFELWGRSSKHHEQSAPYIVEHGTEAQD